MTERKRRRRRSAPEAVEAVEPTRETPKRRRRRTAPERRPQAPVRDPSLRPIWRIAADIFYLKPASQPFPFEKERSKLYPHWRALFCMAYAEGDHMQFGEGGEVVDKRPAAEVIREFIDGTAAVKNKNFQLYRAELGKYL